MVIQWTTFEQAVQTKEVVPFFNSAGRLMVAGQNHIWPWRIDGD